MQPQIIDPQISRLTNEALRQEAWIETVAPIWRATPDRSSDRPWQASFRGWKVGGIQLYRTHSSPQTVERTASQIASLAVDHVYLQQHLTGHSTVEIAGDETPLAHSDIVLVDMAQPVFGRSTTSVDAVGLCIPRRLFDPRLGEIGDLHRRVFSPGANTLIRLLSGHIGNMQHCLDASDEAQRNLLSTATLALCNAALTPASDSAHNGPAVAGIEIRQFIEAQLGQADLGVETLCASFGLSRTPLYAMFDSDGGVASYIRNRRLAKAMRMLSGAEQTASQRISSVAYLCGYRNLKAFSKAFRARYGVNPREVDLSFGQGARWETGETLWSWIKELSDAGDQLGRTVSGCDG